LDAQKLYEAGKVDEAIGALAQRLRESPLDSRSRTFLFELLCFNGELDRAEKQLDILGDENADTRIGAWMYRSALQAERTRREMFREEAFPSAEPPESPSGTLNGEPFESLEDLDPRIGSRLEVFAAGQYTWIPFRHLARITVEPPRRLRDTLWAPAHVTAGPEMRDMELGEVLLPAVYALSYRSPDGDVRLGRTTAVMEDGDTEMPVGARLLLVDGEAIPLLEVRELVIHGS
jgi:type VI secretion system protein ImpE